MHWDKTALGEMTSLRLSEGDWVVKLLPELGGKIYSIRWLGRELLAVNPRKPLRCAQYAAPYAEYDASGFDECFPTIGPCQYPDYPWAGTELPDHGELWSLSWTDQIQDDACHLQVHGVRLPYTFSKSISFAENGAIRFHYRVSNHNPFPLQYLWSAHPLLAPQPGMRILLPHGTRVLVDWSKGARLGDFGALHDWPHTRDCSGKAVDLSLILGEDAGTVEKLYTTSLSEGWCALYNPSDGRFSAFTFSTAQVPTVGLSINLGGWPVGEPGYYNLGLEPCSGYPDRLDNAVEQGTNSCLTGFAYVEWDTYLHAGIASTETGLVASLTQLARNL
jgi:hypothetical protein